MTDIAWRWRWAEVDSELLVSQAVADILDSHRQGLFGVERGGQLFVNPVDPKGLLLAVASSRRSVRLVLARVGCGAVPSGNPGCQRTRVTSGGLLAYASPIHSSDISGRHRKFFQICCTLHAGSAAPHSRYCRQVRKTRRYQGLVIQGRQIH